MRDGRRQRLGLATGTEDPATSNDGYLDRILSDTEATGQSNILNLAQDANVNVRDQRYLNDAYQYYLGGGTGEVPTDTAEIPGAIDTLVDTSGEGQDIATSGLGLGDTTPANTDFEQSLLDQGIGVQGAIGDPVVAPGEIPYTQEQMDAENALPVTQPSFDDQFQSIEDIGTPIDIGFGEGQVDPGLAAGLEGPIIDTSPVTPTITAPSGDIFAANDPLAAEKIDFAPEQQGIIDQAFSKVGSTAENIMNDLSQIPGAVANFANQTVDIFGKKINVGSTLLKAGINRIVGGPISLVFDALGALGLEGGPSLQTDKANSIGLLNENASGGYQDIYGINTQSALGDYDQYNIDRVEDLTDIVADQKSRGLTNTLQMRELEDRQEYNTISGVGGDIDDDPTGDAEIAEQIEADNRTAQAAEIESQRRELQEINARAEKEAADAQAAANAAAAQAAAIAAQNAAYYQNEGGGGGQGDQSGGRSSSSGESDYGGFCFDPSTPIQMADGSIKKIKNIQLGDDTKGGEVTGVFQFKASDDIHNYKGVTVAGGHYVKENNEFIMVKDSPLAIKIDKIPVVYSLDTANRRIFIKNIEFADYNGDGVAKNFLSNAGVTLEGFDKEVLRQVQQRLI